MILYLVGTIFIILDIIEVFGLGSRTGSLIKIIDQLNNLSMKLLQKKLLQKSLDLIFRSIYNPYNPGSKGYGHFC